MRFRPKPGEDAPLPQLRAQIRSAFGSPSPTHGPSPAGAHPTRTFRPVRAQCARRLSWGFVPLQRLPSHTATESSSHPELCAAGPHLRLACASAVSTTLTPSSAWDLVGDTSAPTPLLGFPRSLTSSRTSPSVSRSRRHSLHCYLWRPDPPDHVRSSSERVLATHAAPSVHLRPRNVSSRASSRARTRAPDSVSEAVRLFRVSPRRKRRPSRLLPRAFVSTASDDSRSPQDSRVRPGVFTLRLVAVAPDGLPS